MRMPATANAASEALRFLATQLPPGMDDAAVAKKLPKPSAAIYALAECYMPKP